MSNLKEQIGEKLIQIAPLTKIETYNDLTTEEIIGSINEVKNDVQDKSMVYVLEDLPSTLSRKEAINMSMKIWTHIAKRLVVEYKAL